jgi:hypothetical protein
MNMVDCSTKDDSVKKSPAEVIIILSDDPNPLSTTFVALGLIFIENIVPGEVLSSQMMLSAYTGW